MENRILEPKYQAFFDKCKADLESMYNYTESFLPLLHRYVMLTATLDKLQEEIQNESVAVEHTNRSNKTNTVTSPKWRIFLSLNREALALAKQLRLSPDSAPYGVFGEKEKTGTARFKLV